MSTRVAQSSSVSREGPYPPICRLEPTWATQLRFLESELLERLREVAGVDEVDRIELRVRPRP